MSAFAVSEPVVWPKRERGLHDYPPKNLIQRQIESDKKAFPVILGSLKRDLQNKATVLDNTIHGLIKIILALYIEQESIIEDLPCHDMESLTLIRNVSVKDICDFMIDYRKDNKIPLNNLELIKLSVESILKKRRLLIESRRNKHLKCLQNKAQLMFAFF